MFGRRTEELFEPNHRHEEVDERDWGQVYREQVEALRLALLTTEFDRGRQAADPKEAQGYAHWLMTTAEMYPPVLRSKMAAASLAGHVSNDLSEEEYPTFSKGVILGLGVVASEGRRRKEE